GSRSARKGRRNAWSGSLAPRPTRCRGSGPRLRGAVRRRALRGGAPPRPRARPRAPRHAALSSRGKRSWRCATAGRDRSRLAGRGECAGTRRTRRERLEAGGTARGIAMMTLRPAAERGQTDWGWLDSRHTFSFGEYYDPRHVGFRSLRVINDDRVQPG